MNIKNILTIIISTIFFCFVFGYNPLSSIIYRFSDEWIGEKIELLEKKALNRDCDSAEELAYHYRKANFGSGFGSKGSAWLIFSNSILCGDSKGNIYDMANDKVNATIHLFVNGYDVLEDTSPKMYKKLEEYFMYFPEGHPCKLSVMHTSKIFGENCLKRTNDAMLDSILPKPIM